MIIFNKFKKYVDKNIITQRIEYYEDNDIFLKIDDKYIIKRILLVKIKFLIRTYKILLSKHENQAFRVSKNTIPYSIRLITQSVISARLIIPSHLKMHFV